MYCDFCGTQVPEGAKFCPICGNNLQDAPLVSYKGQDHAETAAQTSIQYQPVEFKVQQKLLAFRPIYKVSDAQDREFMVAKRPFFIIFRPKVNVARPDGTPLGHIRGNFWRTKWQIIDNQGRIHATLKFPYIALFRKWFRLTTPTGTYESGKSFFNYKFEVYDAKGQICFEVNKKVISIRDSFKIISNGLLSPFVTCMAAVIIDQKYHQQK